MRLDAFSCTDFFQGWLHGKLWDHDVYDVTRGWGRYLVFGYIFWIRMSPRKEV